MRKTYDSLTSTFSLDEVVKLTSQPAFTCSKLPIETLEQRCEICSKLTIETAKRPSIVNFEHVIAGWVRQKVENYP